MEITKDDIADWRGGYPDECSICFRKTEPEFLEPEEAGQWICWTCLDHIADAEKTPPKSLKL